MSIGSTVRNCESLPVLTVDRAVRNWHSNSCLLRISWMFSCPSTENPCMWRIPNQHYALLPYQSNETGKGRDFLLLTPSAMRKCSPRRSVLSRTKFRKALMFSGRVMSPSPSTPPSPGTNKWGVGQSQPSWKKLEEWNSIRLCCCQCAQICMGN